jgi:predicted transcriptional regulator
MQLMLKKGLVARDTSSRTHIYRAAVAEDQTRAQLLDRFVDTAFRGSAMDLVMQALGNEDTSEDELKEIKDFIQQIESERKKGK